MRIYWINPPVSNYSIFADTAWMEISNACPSQEWIEPPIDWEKYQELDNIIEDILYSKPDMVCFSSYIWNEHLCNDIAKQLKEKGFEGYTVRGGPQQHSGFELYDYACPPLEAGEPYMVNLLNELTKSTDPERSRKFCEESAILNNSTYLTNVSGEARSMGKMAVLQLETTRGCPYSCTYCEWGGGIGTKLFRKSIENVQAEIDLASLLRFDEIDIVDANFGILDRDVDIVHMLGRNKEKYGFPKGTNIYGVTKNRVENKLRVIEPLSQYKLMDSFSLPFQSLNDEVKKNIKRHDTPIQETLEMAMYIKNEYDVNPRLELIMGLPGTTLDDFYDEMNLVDWVKNWEWIRYPFSVLPATEAAKPFYRATHKIKTAEIPLPMNDCDLSNYYRNPSIITKYRMLEEVVVESYSFTREEYIEMFFMNYAQWVIGPRLNANEKYSVQMKRVYDNIKTEDWYKELYNELDKLTLGKRDYEDFLHYNGKSIHEIVEKNYYGLDN